MASISRANRTVEPRWGGKILRRRRAPATSPYHRPSPPRRPRSPSPTSSSIFGLFASGAGKLLSSVFRRSSSSSSSDDDDDDEDEDDSNDDDTIHSNEAEELNQDGMTPVSNNDHAIVTQQISQTSEAKLVIEKLLLQETFSREECTRLVKIIQSRVVDCPTMKVGEVAKTRKELHERSVGGGIASPRAWLSLSEIRKSSVAFPYSAGSLSALSPGAFALQSHGLDLHNAAIMEAKKWIEEKKLESSSNSALDHGPCTLNTAVLPHVTEDGVASPVDMAKSYMRARPPWASPSLSNIGFKTPPPIGMHLYKDETPYAMGGYSLPSSKDLEEAQWMKEQVGSGIVSHESLTPDLVPGEHNGNIITLYERRILGEGDPSTQLLNSELKVLPFKEVKLAFPSDGDGVVNPNDAHDSSIQMSSQPNSSQPHQLSGLKETHPTLDSRFQGGDNQMQKKENGLGSGIDANGSLSSESSLSSGLKNEDPGLRPSNKTGSNSISPSDGKLATGDPMETCELLSEASVDIPETDEMNHVVDGLQDAASGEPDKQLGIQPRQTLSAVKRGKKAGGYYRRVRGRGK
ncbi:uncharacterized protein LOC131256721 isoform X2 [Magnolia sinica]|uniref:uncharacterized protein LOC131256721 isoform X2 n=1 Tax=Magnolia sinica TaxID=86752 RepID=UPI002658278B|nr:uncharacterized protein LOC131256721 isoform X2 [Magnolia sinica]